MKLKSLLRSDIRILHRRVDTGTRIRTWIVRIGISAARAQTLYGDENLGQKPTYQELA